MTRKETIKEFYANHGQEYPKAGQFNIYRRGEFACDSTSLPPNRRDFYKITMITGGTGIISYADKSINIEQAVYCVFKSAHSLLLATDFG
ncbi:MAG: hypothetical protein QM727_13150 [Niabella sp.]